MTSLSTLKKGNTDTVVHVNTTSLQQTHFRFSCMTIPLLIISIRTESNVTEALLPVVIFLVGAERHRKSNWIRGWQGWGECIL